MYLKGDYDFYYHHKLKNKRKHATETIPECEMIDYPQSLTANTKDQKDNSIVVHKHAANETHNGSKSERDTTLKILVKNALYERGR